MLLCRGDARAVIAGLVSNASPAAPKLTDTNMTNGIASAGKGRSWRLGVSSRQA
jgi:hypothetical protein